ncbi:NAD-dependent epimerase/dehydratase family protein [Candidatus Peribacteria bacterium]|nr:MAG: NAD-dependent epimerase/dehydratase family protein [Candidatus Peribacteria bacterium]
MKILVTGSSGTIGTRLCEKLLAAGHTVVGADWEPCQWKEEVEALRIDIDLRHAEEFGKLPTDVELIIHLAANARVYELVEHPERAMDNFQDTFNVLEFARKNGIKKLMFASSRETYGNIHLPEGQKYSEDKAHFMTCESPYTASKIGGEALFEAYKRCYKMETIIWRFSNVYGMYDNSVRVVPLYFRQAKNNEPMKVFGRDKCLDFTYIDDCVGGIMLGIEKWETAKNDTYNLAYGQGTTILHLAERMKELLGSTSTLDIGEARTGEVTHYIADITKAQTKLGYNPQTPFDRGIEKAVEWYKANT